MHVKRVNKRVGFKPTIAAIEYLMAIMEEGNTRIIVVTRKRMRANSYFIHVLMHKLKGACERVREGEKLSK